MGLTRKMMSGMTAGAVDFRSDKERAARNTAKSAKYDKKSYKLLQQQAKAEQAASRAQAAPAATEAQVPAPKGKSALGKVFGSMSAGATAKFMDNASPEIQAEIARGMESEQPQAEVVGDPVTPADGGSVDLVEGLVRLTALRDSGALTEDQFEVAKERLLAEQ